MEELSSPDLRGSLQLMRARRGGRSVDMELARCARSVGSTNGWCSWSAVLGATSFTAEAIGSAPGFFDLGEVNRL